MKLNTTYLNPVSINDFLFSNLYDKVLLEDIVNGVIDFPAMGKTGICLHGTYGTGKTTLALRLPDLLDQQKLRGKANRGNFFFYERFYNLTQCHPGNDSIQQVREITERVDSLQSYSKSGWHFEVLDEVDLFTDKAQDMLKSLMTFNKDTIFIMTTNHPSKFSQGLVNRCHMIEMNAVSHDDLVGKGKQWLTRLGLSDGLIDDDELFELAKRSKGSIRDFGNDLIRSASKR